MALPSLPLHFQPDLFLLLCSSAVFLAIKPTPGFFCTMSLMQRAAAALSQQHCRLCAAAGGSSAPAEQQHLPQLAAPPDASAPCGTASGATAPASVVLAGEQDQTSSRSPCSQALCRDRPALSSQPDPAPSPALRCELLLPVVPLGGFPLDPHCSPHCPDALQRVHAPGQHVAPGYRQPLSVHCVGGDAGSWDTGAAITCPRIRCEHDA